uniref:Uncharacterized protein n=1 Tax=Timema douglasi TaxID=61478 RepID=A0A7R8ZCF6_TIMDO|nr:unnamed protein product [Timema douglasi]
MKPCFFKPIKDITRIASSPMASLVLTDSSQLTADGFVKLPDQIMYPYAEPNDLQKHTIEKITENIGDSTFGQVSMRQLTVAEDTSQISWSVIQTFDEEDAVSIREAKVATSFSTVVSDLVHVKSYFGNLPGVIVSPEARDLPLIESVKIMHTILESVKQTPGPVASSVAKTIEQVLQRDPGWRTMVAVSDILGGQSTPLQEINLNSSE